MDPFTAAPINSTSMDGFPKTDGKWRGEDEFIRNWNETSFNPVGELLTISDEDTATYHKGFLQGYTKAKQEERAMILDLIYALGVKNDKT